MSKNRSGSVPTERIPQSVQQRTSGFSLLEVLIAFAILAGVLGTAYGIYADGLRRTTKSEAIAEATARAENFLARLGADLPLKDAEGALPEGGHWRVTATPRDASNTEAASNRQSLILYDVRVHIQLAIGNTVSVDSIRLGKQR